MKGWKCSLERGILFSLFLWKENLYLKNFYFYFYFLQILITFMKQVFILFLYYIPVYIIIKLLN